MRTQDMEPQIDQLGLIKLEEKLEHSEVHYFICAQNTTEDEETIRGELVVFDRKGRAFINWHAGWEADGNFKVEELTLPATDRKCLTVNGFILTRYPEYDLHPSDHVHR